MTVSEFILGGSLTVSILYCVTLYSQREELSRENAEQSLKIEILKDQEKKILALVARLSPRPVVPDPNMAFSCGSCEPVSVESMER